MCPPPGVSTKKIVFQVVYKYVSVQTYNPAVAIAQFISGELKFSIMGNFKDTNPKEYLRFGVYTMLDGKDLLFIAIQGFFASSAWCKGDKEYNATLGQSFEGITSDDGKSWSLDRDNIRRVSSKEEFDRLLKDSCKEFKDIAAKYMQ